MQATLNVGPDTKPSKDAPLIATWQGKLPISGDGLSARCLVGISLHYKLPHSWSWNGASSAAASGVDFFPDASEDYEVQPATERAPAEAGKIRLRKVVKKLEGDWPRQASGVLIQQFGPTRSAYEVKLPIESSTAVTAGNSITTSAIGLVAPPLWKMLLYAFLGGLILNVMPCVLPVIALKILGFVGQAKDDVGEARKLGLIHTFGVLASFLLLALIVVGLRAAGHSVGWGFQFTNPYFLVLITALVTLIALNLFGVFEVTAGGRTLDAATALTSKHGARGAFFNGLLATVAGDLLLGAHPRGGMGFAFAQQPAIIILVMLAVGLGLAAPYLVLSWHPAWLRFLPKPGLWMERFKVAMGFLMLGAGGVAVQSADHPLRRAGLVDGGVPGVHCGGGLGVWRVRSTRQETPLAGRHYRRRCVGGWLCLCRSRQTSLA